MTRRRWTVVVLVGAVLAGGLTAGPAWAWWTDSASGSGILGALTVVSQAQPTCQTIGANGGTARVTFTKTDARYEYTWELRETGGTVRASGTAGTNTAQGGTVTIDITGGLVSLNANLNLVVRARLKSATSWVASATTTTQVRVDGLIALPSAKCGWT